MFRVLIESVGDLDVRPILGSISAPTLVIQRREDRGANRGCPTGACMSSRACPPSGGSIRSRDRQGDTGSTVRIHDGPVGKELGAARFRSDEMRHGATKSGPRCQRAWSWWGRSTQPRLGALRRQLSRLGSTVMLLGPSEGQGTEIVRDEDEIRPTDGSH